MSSPTGMLRALRFSLSNIPSPWNFRNRDVWFSESIVRCVACCIAQGETRPGRTRGGNDSVAMEAVHEEPVEPRCGPSHVIGQ
jgi:hypothetical protein